MNQNPYQPPESIDLEHSVAGTVVVEYDLSRLGIRAGEAQFMLRTYTVRLSIVSVVMIVVSTYLIILGFQQGMVMWLAAFAGCFLLSLVAYLGSTYVQRERLRETMRDLRIGSAGHRKIVSDEQQLTVWCDGERHSWSNELVVAYRAESGLVLIVESRAHVFVSRKGLSNSETGAAREMLMTRYKRRPKSLS